MFSDCSRFVRIGFTNMFSDYSLTAVVLLGLDLLICSLITNMFSDCSSFVRIGFTNMFSDY